MAEKLAKNTKLQQEVQREQDERAEREAGFPLFRVGLTGDDVEWAPRQDQTHWEPVDPDDERGPWQGKGGVPVVMPARATVLVRAVNANMAEVAALNANPGYHTIEFTEEVKE